MLRPLACFALTLGLGLGLLAAWTPTDPVDGAYAEEEAIWAPARRAIDGGGEGYIGADACRTCHEEAHDKWMGSSHANTYLPASEDNLPGEVIAEETAHHPPGKSRFRKTEDGWQVETVGPDGKPTWYDLTHVVGRMRVRMYITTMPDGRKQVLPGMLEEPTATWFDYTHLIFSGSKTDFDTPPVVKPGDGSFWTGPIRSWETKCARCHVSGHVLAPHEKGQVGLRGKQRRLGVDCEMCHGPGQKHATHHEAKRKGPDPILRYAKLARRAQVSLCLRCHMESEVEDPDFRHGEDIFEHVTPTLMLSPERMDPYGRQLELIYDGVPFSSSRCAEEGGLTCVSCHDPHGSPHRSQTKRAANDDRMCTTCHEEIGAAPEKHSHHKPGTPGGRCVDCHMPFLAVERRHGVIADHTISIPRLDLPGDRVAKDACTWCHQQGLWAPDDVKKLDAPALREAYKRWWPDPLEPALWQQALAAARSGKEDAAPALATVAADASVPAVARASATRLLAKYGKDGVPALLELSQDPDSLVRRSAFTALAASKGAAVDKALLRGLRDRSKPVRAAAAVAAIEGFTRVQANRPLLDAAIPVLRAHAEADPGQEGRWFGLAAALDVAGDRKGALVAYERYLALFPGATHVQRRVEALRGGK